MKDIFSLGRVQKKPAKTKNMDGQFSFIYRAIFRLLFCLKYSNLEIFLKDFEKLQKGKELESNTVHFGDDIKERVSFPILAGKNRKGMH